MAQTDVAQVGREVFDAWNAHDVERYLALVDANCRWESDTLPMEVVDKEGHRRAMEMYLKAFPDLQFDIRQILVSGDTAIIQWKSSATHKGELTGIAPTGRPVSVNGCSISKIRDGKVVHAAVYWDTGTLLRQIGVLSGQGSTA
jgi:steroid delta-isomerase-like uncharacterized protein